MAGKLEGVVMLKAIHDDKRYNNLSIHDLKIRRANMIGTGYTKYDLACVQYHIMRLENRLDSITQWNS